MESLSIIDGLEAGKHYWVPDIKKDKSDKLLNLQSTADNAYFWYCQHSLLIHAKNFAKYLRIIMYFL